MIFLIGLLVDDSEGWNRNTHISKPRYRSIPTRSGLEDARCEVKRGQATLDKRKRLRNPS